MVLLVDHRAAPHVVPRPPSAGVLRERKPKQQLWFWEVIDVPSPHLGSGGHVALRERVGIPAGGHHWGAPSAGSPHTALK